MRVETGLPVGVAFAFAVDEFVLQAMPGFCLCLIAVEDEVSVAGGAIAVKEEEVAVGEAIEFGIGDVAFVDVGHGEFRTEVEGAG